MLWIRIGFNPDPAFYLNVYLDPAFYLDLYPDPGSQTNADPSGSDLDPRRIGSESSSDLKVIKS